MTALVAAVKQFLKHPLTYRLTPDDLTIPFGLALLLGLVARLAALRRLETALFEESLFTFSEDEWLLAIPTINLLIGHFPVFLTWKH